MVHQLTYTKYEKKKRRVYGRTIYLLGNNNETRSVDLINVGGGEVYLSISAQIIKTWHRYIFRVQRAL